MDYIFCFGFAILLLSCKSDKSELVSSTKKMDVVIIEKQIEEKKIKYLDLVSIWKEEGNGHFFISKKIDDFMFTSIYKPYSVLVMEEMENINLNDTITNEFKKKTATYNNMHFFNFNIQNETFKNELIKLDVDDNQDYYDRISYYSFSSKNDAYVVEGKDTLKCDFVNFERTFEANPSIMLSFGFSRKSTTNRYENLKFVFEDKIFNKGKLIFNFDAQPILLLNYLKPLN